MEGEILLAGGRGELCRVHDRCVELGHISLTGEHERECGEDEQTALHDRLPAAGSPHFPKRHY
jgi:hypothetical protein